MNDCDLKQLLESADATARVDAVHADLASRVRVQAARESTRARRLRVATIAMVPLLVAGFVVLKRRTRSTQVSPAPRTAVAVKVIPLDNDTAIEACESHIERLFELQRVCALQTKLAHVVDPIADANERGARQMLNEIDRVSKDQPNPAIRRELLASVATLYPSTISGTAARLEIEPLD